MKVLIEWESSVGIPTKVLCQLFQFFGFLINGVPLNILHLWVLIKRSYERKLSYRLTQCLKEIIIKTLEVENNFLQQRWEVIPFFIYES